jgi:hypothetical protein
MWRRHGAREQSAGRCSDGVAQYTDSAHNVSVQYGHQRGATHTVPALPHAPRARPTYRRGVPAPPGAAFAGRQRRPHAIQRIDSGKNSRSEAQ